MNFLQEYQSGRWAREANRELSRCPFYEMGDEGARRRQAWRQGWHDADKEIRGTK